MNDIKDAVNRFSLLKDRIICQFISLYFSLVDKVAYLKLLKFFLLNIRKFAPVTALGVRFDP